MQQPIASRAVFVGLVVLAAASFAAAAPAQSAPAQSAPTPHEIGGAKGWTAYSYPDQGGEVCYLVGYPAKTEPASASRRRVDAIVTHRPREKTTNVVNFDVGYPFKPGSSAVLDIDGHRFTLFVDKDTAWAPDAATDKAVTEALARGRSATLKGTPERGAATTDIYELAGFADALAAIDKACKVRR